MDYNFMKTGFDNTNSSKGFSKEQIENLKITISLFTSNAMINAAKYVELCERNGITQTDLEYGLKYEVFEFLKRPDFQESLEEVRKDYYEEVNKVELERQDAVEDDDLENDLEEFIVDDDEIDDFKRLDKEITNKEDKDFVSKLHNYYDTWDSWVPETPLEKVLKNSIESNLV